MFLKLKESISYPREVFIELEQLQLIQGTESNTNEEQNYEWREVARYHFI